MNYDCEIICWPDHPPLCHALTNATQTHVKTWNKRPLICLHVRKREWRNTHQCWRGSDLIPHVKTLVIWYNKFCIVARSVQLSFFFIRTVPAYKASGVCRWNRPDPSLPTPRLSPVDNALTNRGQSYRKLLASPWFHSGHVDMSILLILTFI